MRIIPDIFVLYQIIDKPHFRVACLLGCVCDLYAWILMGAPHRSINTMRVNEAYVIIFLHIRP